MPTAHDPGPVVRPGPDAAGRGAAAASDPLRPAGHARVLRADRRGVPDRHRAHRRLHRAGRGRWRSTRRSRSGCPGRAPRSRSAPAAGWPGGIPRARRSPPSRCRPGAGLQFVDMSDADREPAARAARRLLPAEPARAALPAPLARRRAAGRRPDGRLKRVARVRVVLVRPETSANVGACARVVRNTGAAGLDLVEPRRLPHGRVLAHRVGRPRGARGGARLRPTWRRRSRASSLAVALHRAAASGGARRPRTSATPRPRSPSSAATPWRRSCSGPRRTASRTTRSRSAAAPRRSRPTRPSPPTTSRTPSRSRPTRCGRAGRRGRDTRRGRSRPTTRRSACWSCSRRASSRPRRAAAGEHGRVLRGVARARPAHRPHAEGAEAARAPGAQDEAEPSADGGAAGAVRRRGAGRGRLLDPRAQVARARSSSARSCPTATPSCATRRGRCRPSAAGALPRGRPLPRGASAGRVAATASEVPVPVRPRGIIAAVEASPGNVAPRILSRPEHNISRKNIDPDALKVLYRLKNAGFVAYLVGGGVRDLLLERQPKDFDIGTSAHPQQVRKLFRNCFIVGRRFRLAHVRFGRKVIEVSTFRRAAEPEAGDTLIRRDNTFGTPEEDAFRRDFTVNALFYDIANFSVIDWVSGLDDLTARVIRTIGDPARALPRGPGAHAARRGARGAARLHDRPRHGRGDPLPARRDRAQQPGAHARGALQDPAPGPLAAHLRDAARRTACSRTCCRRPTAPSPRARQALAGSLARLDAHRQAGLATPDQLTNALLMGSLLVPLGVPLRRVAVRQPRAARAPPSRRAEPVAAGARRGSRRPARGARRRDRGARRRGRARARGRTGRAARRCCCRSRGATSSGCGCVLLAQRRLREAHGPGAARRTIAAKSYFEDAVRWLEIHGGPDGRELAARVARARRVAVPSREPGAGRRRPHPGAEAPSEGDGQSRRRRRRAAAAGRAPSPRRRPEPDERRAVANGGRPWPLSTESEIESGLAARARAGSAAATRSRAASRSPTSRGRWRSSTAWRGLAEAMDHHPDIDIRYSKVTLTLTTHDAAGSPPATSRSPSRSAREGARRRLGRASSGASSRCGSATSSPGRAAAAELDVTDEAAVPALVARVRPDVVFNATAYNRVDAAEGEPERAFAVNALAPRTLARAAREAGALLVHVSTDYVFDGASARPYREDDARAAALASTAPRSSKARSTCSPPGPEHLVVRTSGVLGRRRLGAEGRLVRGPHPGAGARGPAAARRRGPGVRAHLRGRAGRGARRAGAARGARPLHVTNEGSCSWHELAVAALAAAGLDASGRGDHGRRAAPAGAPPGLLGARQRALPGARPDAARGPGRTRSPSSLPEPGCP